MICNWFLLLAYMNNFVSKCFQPVNADTCRGVLNPANLNSLCFIRVRHNDPFSSDFSPRQFSLRSSHHRLKAVFISSLVILTQLFHSLLYLLDRVCLNATLAQSTYSVSTCTGALKDVRKSEVQFDRFSRNLFLVDYYNLL